MKPLPDIHGLILAGGHSRRMGRDKASIVYRESGQPEWRRLASLLQPLVSGVFLSVRQDQQLQGHGPNDAPLLPDCVESVGPLTGLISAFERDPNAAWLVIACDLPLLGEETLRYLLDHRGASPMTAFRSASDGMPEPLCAIYEPSAREILRDAFANDIRCPRKIMMRSGSDVKLLELPDSNALDNANSPEDFERLREMLKTEGVS